MNNSISEADVIVSHIQFLCLHKSRKNKIKPIRDRVPALLLVLLIAIITGRDRKTNHQEVNEQRIKMKGHPQIKNPAAKLVLPKVDIALTSTQLSFL